MTPHEKSFYDKGYVQAVADRREQDRLETEQIVRHCTRTPEITSPLEHYQKMNEESAAIAKEREWRLSL